MEKTINFAGQDVRFRVSMKTLLIYKAQTGREYLADTQKLSGIVVKDKRGNIVKDVDGNPKIDLSVLDTEMLCGIAWAMAKTADSNVPPMYDWVDQFDEFPFETILFELMPMITKTIKPDRKNA